MKLSLFLALRYLKPKRTFVSVITLLSILGVTLGIMVLILVVSVMTGMEHEMRSKILAFQPHIRVQEDGRSLHDWQALRQRILAVPGVTAAAPFVMGPAIAEFDGQRWMPMVRGIDPELERDVINLAPCVLPGGDLTLSGDDVAVGQQMADQLGMSMEGRVTLYATGNLDELLKAVQKAEEDSRELEKVKQLILPKDLRIAAVFKTDHYDFDSGIFVVPLFVAQELFGLSEADSVSGLALRVANPNRAEDVAAALRKILNGGPEEEAEESDADTDESPASPRPFYVVQTWMQLNQTFFSALATERNMMILLLFFIVIVAAFGIMNTLITVTVQKTREIGVMRALGATRWQITGVFLWQGIIVGVLGNISGLLMGMWLVTYRNEVKDWLARVFGIEVFPASIYQFSKIPAVVERHDVAVICIGAFVICTLAAYLPAWIASRQDPVKALRSE